jgi:hypothetical protein
VSAGGAEEGQRVGPRLAESGDDGIERGLSKEGAGAQGRCLDVDVEGGLGQSGEHAAGRLERPNEQDARRRRHGSLLPDRR